jgi:peptidyl-tRNA hydrolase
MPFLLEERPDVERMLTAAVDALEMVVIEGIDQAMQEYNRKADV